MAQASSYPIGTPKLTDTLLGMQYDETKEPALKNFSVIDIAALMSSTTITYNSATALTTISLNVLYPQAMVGFKVQGVNPSLLTNYEKTDSVNWIKYPITIA